jgi:hypothetical protein
VSHQSELIALKFLCRNSQIVISLHTFKQEPLSPQVTKITFVGVFSSMLFGIGDRQKSPLFRRLFLSAQRDITPM